MSKYEKLLGKHIELTGLPNPVKEYRFHAKRKWRFDFAWPDLMVAAEVDGGIYSRGRHTRGKGFEKDAEKGNAAVLDGWRVLHFTPSHVTKGYAVRTIEELLARVAGQDIGLTRGA